VVEVTFLLPFAFLINAAPFTRAFRQIEDVCGWVVRADARKEPAAWPGENFDLGILSSEAREHGFNILDLEAKVI